ncbi:MAG: Hpt domain-containing protein [Phycisphaerales bacterium]|nr:Hpt domain-containing protein [Phycisphaerales bacterium]
MTELVSTFVRELPERLATLQGSLDSGDLGSVMRQIHQIRGAGGGYGFDPISEAAGKIEDFVRSRPEADRSLASIRAEVDGLIDLCRRATS